MTSKPPLGLRPRHIAEMSYCLDRSGEISRACLRCRESGIPIPDAWTNEYENLRRRYMSIEKASILRKDPR